MNSKIRAILKRIKSYENIVIVRHIGPDPDAIAGQIALRDAIKLKFPSKKVYAVGASVAKFKHFGELDKMELLEKIDKKKTLLFVIDCPNIARIDGANIDDYAEVIKIDHHPFIDRMGIIEWVDTKYTSACEMITEFLITARFKANKKIAENLYLGVVSDSDRFLFDTTTPRTFELMAVLIKNSKIRPSKLYPRLYLRPLNEQRFQAYITEHLHVTENGFASLKIDKTILEKYDVDAGTPSNLVNNFNNIKEIYCWALVTYDEKQNLYKVNIRSRGPQINTVAEKYNGGGHNLAAGARVINALDVDKLLRELDNACKKYKDENNIEIDIKNIVNIDDEPTIKENIVKKALKVSKIITATKDNSENEKNQKIEKTGSKKTTKNKKKKKNKKAKK